MSRSRDKASGNLAHLQRLIAELAGVDGEARRIQRAVANTIVGQMLPPGVVKGGTAMKLRLGEAGSRFTPDPRKGLGRRRNAASFRRAGNDVRVVSWCICL